jgi:hypothetical protein
MIADSLSHLTDNINAGIDQLAAIPREDDEVAERIRQAMARLRHRNDKLAKDAALGRCLRCGNAAANGTCDKTDCDHASDPHAEMLNAAMKDEGTP